MQIYPRSIHVLLFWNVQGKQKSRVLKVTLVYFSSTSKALFFLDTFSIHPDLSKIYPSSTFLECSRKAEESRFESDPYILFFHIEGFVFFGYILNPSRSSQDLSIFNFFGMFKESRRVA